MLTEFINSPHVDVSCEDFDGIVCLETIRIKDASVNAFVFLRNIFTALRSANEFQNRTHLLDAIVHTDPTFNVKTTSVLKQPDHCDRFMLKVRDSTRHARITHAIDANDFTRVQTIVDDMYFVRENAKTVDLLNPDMLYYEYAVRDPTGLFFRRHCYVRVIGHDGTDMLNMSHVHKHCLMQIFRSIYSRSYDLAESFHVAYMAMFPTFKIIGDKITDILAEIPREDVRSSRVHQSIELLIRMMQTGTTVGMSDLVCFYYMIARSVAHFYEPVSMNTFRTTTFTPSDFTALLIDMRSRVKYSNWSPKSSVMYDAYFRDHKHE